MDLGELDWLLMLPWRKKHFKLIFFHDASYFPIWRENEKFFVSYYLVSILSKSKIVKNYYLKS